MEKVKVTVNNIEIEVEKGTTVLNAAKQAGFSIPTLCYHEDIKPTSVCGVCVVQVDGSSALTRSCSLPVREGMKITTNNKDIRNARKMVVELILSDHDVNCPTCVANGKCELQQLAYTMNIDIDHLESILDKKPVDRSSLAITRDPNKCINCGRCVEVCQQMQTVDALTFINRGFESMVGTAFNNGMLDSICVNCGQCTVYCPTGALRERDNTDDVWDALLDPKKHVVVQAAPSIRVSLGEEFGMEIGALTVGKMYTAFKMLGFDNIFDTNFSADLTIMEEGTELVNRIKNGEELPVITSCCPGWIKFMETNYSHLANHVSTAKSPQQMMGVLAKTYYAEKMKIDPANIVSVSIMPCTAKKFEADREEMKDSGYQDVDVVLTTRELVRMIKEAGIDFNKIQDSDAFNELAEYSGAGTIFGATGGVMEAALRSGYYLITGEELEDIDIKAVRGMAGVKEATININDLPVKVGVAHGLGNARKILDKISQELKETSKSSYHFVEIMACPGGCVGGGGQPSESSFAMRARRGESLYKEDSDLPLRKSHQNEAVLKCYEEFLGKPASEKAHHLLHTHYYKRDKVKGQAVEKITG